ncbi:MAG: hypothetical protein ACREXT_16690 [Gammaproteobacteria bacterium]
MQRISGTAPRTVSFSAIVRAIVREYRPDTSDPARTGYGATGIGGITQTEREVLLMASDLAIARFPLPVKESDKIILATTGEKLNVTRVDGEKRSQAGAVELFAAGVA